MSTSQSKIEDLKRTKDVRDVLLKLGLGEELERAGIKKVRAGRGKRRGRRYKLKKGPLMVVSKRCALYEAARNIPGVDVCIVNELNAELLAPGTQAGRLTLWTESAIENMGKEKLFWSKK